MACSHVSGTARFLFETRMGISLKIITFSAIKQQKRLEQPNLPKLSVAVRSRYFCTWSYIWAERLFGRNRNNECVILIGGEIGLRTTLEQGKSNSLIRLNLTLSEVYLSTYYNILQHDLLWTCVSTVNFSRAFQSLFTFSLTYLNHPDLV